MASIFGTAALCVTCLALLSGCGAPPQGAGLATQVLAGADSPTADFAVVPVTRDTLPVIARWPNQPVQVPTVGWLPKGSSTGDELIAAGDKFDVSIWTNEDNGLLNMPGQKNIPLPGLKVSSDGTLFLPYAGAVPVAGLTVDQARQTIQDRLAAISPGAQVLLGHQSGFDNSVQVVGGLPTSGLIPIPSHNFTVMDLIATAGGIPPIAVNPEVNVTRNGKLYGVAFNDLVQHPALDAVLRPGDRVMVVPDPRYFLSFGAAAHETQVRFPTAKVTAMDAVALIGGLIDVTADPKAVMVLRNYPASAVRSDGKGPTRRRTIFVFNLVTADGLFSAGEFQVQDKDLVMVAQSPLLTEQAVISFVAGLVGITNNAVSAALNSKKF